MKFLVSCLLAVLFLLPAVSHSQINDCATAQVVCDNEDLSFNPDGPGLNDFADPDNFPGCITALDQNSAWFYFEINPTAPPNLVLGFTIHPKGGWGEDYDWALFGPDVSCGALGAPIRCSSSSAACGFCPDTGMGMGTTDFTEGPGTGDGFVSTLVVQPGQGFYLMIDNWLGTTNGFILEWTGTAADYLDCAAQPPCALTAIAGDDIEACEGETVLLNGQSIGNHGNETYTWAGTNGGTAFLSDPNIQDPIIELPGGFSGSITYTLTVMEDTCVGEDQLELTVNPLPEVEIFQIGPFCPTDPPQTLSGTPAAGIWGGAATGNMFNPMTNGPGIHTVTYTYTDGNGCVAVASIDIEVHEAPEVSIDPNPAELCDSEAPVILTANASGGAGGYIYNWDTPSGPEDGSSYIAYSSGLHTITVTDDNGCYSTDAVNVIFHPNPFTDITDPGPLCQSIPLVTLNAIPPGGDFSGSIISSNGEIHPNMTTPGTYTVTYTYVDLNNCEGTATESITIQPTPSAISGNNGPLCEGQSIVLDGSTNVSGTSISFHWDGPNGYSSDVQNPTDATLGGMYILHVTVDGCVSAADTTLVLLTAMPPAEATNGGPYCAGDPIQLFGSTTASGITISYAWTGPNGYFSDIQNPNDAVDDGIYSLILTVDNCSSAPVETEVIFSPPTDAVALNTGPYCDGDSIELIGHTNTTGMVTTYAWTGPNGYSSSDQSPKDASLPGFYQLVVNVDGCNSAGDTTAVIVNTNPQPVITGQDTFCTGFSSVLDSGPGYAGYVWEDASQNQTHEVFASGNFSVTVTDLNGCTGDTTFAVTETASLSPVISGALEFCEGAGTILDAGSGYTGYLWSTGEIGQTIEVTTEGNFGVVVTDVDGCNGSATITTTIHATPVVTIGGSTTYCIGGFTVLDAGSGYSSYSWNDNSIAQTLTVTTPGTYSVSIVDQFGCAGSAGVTITESTSLSPVITGNLAFCENGSTVLNGGSGFATYLWSDGSVGQTLLVDSAGLYSVSVSDGQGCTGETTVAIAEVLPPSADVLPTAELCNTTAGGSILNLYDLVLSGDAGGTWEDADHSGAVGLFTNLNFNNIPAGDYHFIYTTNSAIAPCPESVYQVVVTVLDCSCPDVFFLNAAPLCNAGDTLDLATILNTAESGVWSLLQAPPGISPGALNGTLFDVTSADPGQYILQFTLQNQPPPGCPLDFQAILQVDQVVDAGIANPPLAFCYTDTQLINLQTLLLGADANGTWTETSSMLSQGNAFNAANGTFATNTQSPGTYTFEYALNSNGACPADAAEVTIVVNPLPLVVIADAEVFDCSIAVQSLSAAGSSTGPEYSISWTGPGILSDGNEHTLFPTIDKAGVYSLTITNTLTHCSQTGSVIVSQNTAAPSTALITSQNPSCFGEQHAFIQIDQVIGGTPPYQYSLNNGPLSSNTNFPSLSAGIYEVALEDANGCRWDTLMELLSPPELTLDLGPDLELELGETAVVQALVNLTTTQIDTLIWSPGDLLECFDFSCLEGMVQGLNSVTLSATVFDINGCHATDQLTITVRKDRRIYFPTAFSPNDDGINDLFYIFGDERQIVKIKKFLVFNRWGDVLYEAIDFLPNDPSKSWDGRFHNEKMNPGVYVYLAEVEFIDGLVQGYTGDVTLMK